MCKTSFKGVNIFILLTYHDDFPGIKFLLLRLVK